MSQEAIYPPSAEFVAQANVKGMEGYQALYQQALNDPEKFWGELAEKEIHWFKKFALANVAKMDLPPWT